MVKRGNTRKNNRRRRSNQMGGRQMISPADVGDSSMQEPSQLSTAQGKEYDAIHAEQHGGAFLEGAPVGTTGVLDASLRDTARVSFLDQSIGDIQGMSDQSGGAKRKSRRSKRKSKTSKRKSKTSKRKSKRSKSSKRRKTRGGGIALEPADYSSPTHLLPASAEAKALMQMNPEWQLASNPKAFAPN
jgi:hypothetical protein